MEINKSIGPEFIMAAKPKYVYVRYIDIDALRIMRMAYLTYLLYCVSSSH